MPVQPIITSVVWTGTDVPSGLALDRSNGVFSGTPVNTGTSGVPVSVETNYGMDSKVISIVVNESSVQPAEYNALDIETSSIVLEEEEAISGQSISIIEAVSVSVPNSLDIETSSIEIEEEEAISGQFISVIETSSSGGGSGSGSSEQGGGGSSEQGGGGSSSGGGSEPSEPEPEPEPEPNAVEIETSSIILEEHEEISGKSISVIEAYHAS